MKLQNSPLEQTLLLSLDNMSGNTICHHDDIQIDEYGSHEVPSLINVILTPSIPQTIGSGGNGGVTKSKVTFSYMDKKPDIDTKLNEVVFHKNKQDIFRSNSF